MTGNEDTVLPRYSDDIDLHTLVMVFTFSFGEPRANDAVSNRPTSDFNGGNKLEPEGGFEPMQRALADYKAEIVPEFEAVPRSQNDVRLAVLDLENLINELVQRKDGTSLVPFSASFVSTVIQDFDDTIDELRNCYEISDTEPLEAVRDKLQAWLDNLDRQHVPHPSYPEGPV